MLDGDQMAKKYKQPRLAGQKYPLIHFPSEQQHGLSQSRLVLPDEADKPLTKEPEPINALHICGGLVLPLQLSQRDAFEFIQMQMESYDVLVGRENHYQLRVKHGTDRNSPEYVLTYDRKGAHIENIQRFPEYAMDLMPEEIRAALPPLYATENDDNQAIVSVKYFTPDAGWTWYPTEFDGRDLFFGLVDGLEAELGYFSLRELQEVRGALGLPIERDLDFGPQTLAQVRENLSR